MGGIVTVYRNLRENYEQSFRYEEADKFFLREMKLKRRYREKRIGNRQILIRVGLAPLESDSDKAVLQTIEEKIAPLINAVDNMFITNLNATRQEIFDSILKNSVTNLWLVSF